ncbi:hypothetical protein E3N88_24186 [Mikania micrantha]|uniref:Uncharacterized protein n=1 Tax=Mikania micrantha TaxID=192012 RepID=A0A5N6NHX1_9ASTR|nr:hypothetical protein E3N88_24186 [Mikania micrantha]
MEEPRTGVDKVIGGSENKEGIEDKGRQTQDEFEVAGEEEGDSLDFLRGGEDGRSAPVKGKRKNTRSRERRRWRSAGSLRGKKWEMPKKPEGDPRMKQLTQKKSRQVLKKLKADLGM